MHSSISESSREGTSSEMETLLEEYRKELEEDLSRKIEEKEREYREGIARLDEMTHRTFEIVRQEEEQKIAESRAFEEDLRNSCTSMRRQLYEKATDPLRIQRVTCAIWPRVIGEEQMEKERGESS